MTVMTGDTVEDLMAEIARLAPAKKHHLGKDMVNGSRRLTLITARMVLANLQKCPDIEPAKAGPAQDPAPHQPQQQGTRPSLPPMAAFENVPAGYYATPPREGSDSIDYWRVEKGKDGTKWAGRTFVRRVLGGPSGDRKLRSVQIDNIQQRVALKKITELGLEESRNLFADTLERCTDCSTPLTDPVSRAARKGPYCRNKKS